MRLRVFLPRGLAWEMPNVVFATALPFRAEFYNPALAFCPRLEESPLVPGLFSLRNPLIRSI
jgi:hypothetical protein